MIFSRVVSFLATSTATKYIIVWFSSEFNPRIYKDNQMLLFMHMNAWTIFQYSMQSCISNRIRCLVIFSRVVLFCAKSTATRCIIIWLSIELNSINCKGNHISIFWTRMVGLISKKNCKGNHILLYMIIYDGSIFRSSIQSWIGKTIYSIMIFSMVVSLCTNNSTAKYKIVWMSFDLYPLNYKDNHISYIFCHYIWLWFVRQFFNVSFTGALATKSIV